MQCVVRTLSGLLQAIFIYKLFHVAVRLFSYISQMTSKCGKNEKVANDSIAECVTDVAGYLSPAH